MDRRIDLNNEIKTTKSISPPARRIGNKGRKDQQPQGSRWADILRENLGIAADGEDMPVKAPLEITPAGESAELHTEIIENTSAPESADLHTMDEADYGELLKKLSEDPELLLDSHTGGPYTPPKPGKWLNSTG